MQDELYGRPGGLVDQAVFKVDAVTLPELSVMSTNSNFSSNNTCMVLYVPLAFWFSRPGASPLSLNTENGDRIECRIRVQLRSTDEIAFSLPVNTTNTEVLKPQAVDRGGTIRNLEWDMFDITLWADTVMLERQEALTIAKSGPVLVTTVQPFTDESNGTPLDSTGRISRKLPFKGAVKSLIWAIGDDTRLEKGRPETCSNQRMTIHTMAKMAYGPCLGKEHIM